MTRWLFLYLLMLTLCLCGCGAFSEFVVENEEAIRTGAEVAKTAAGGGVLGWIIGGVTTLVIGGAKAYQLKKKGNS